MYIELIYIREGGVDVYKRQALLRKLRKLKGVKKVFVRSGLRYDYVLADNNKDFVRELCEFHVSCLLYTSRCV